MSRLVALEHLGRAQPAVAAAEAGRLLADAAPDAADRLELLTVHGLLLAAARETDAARAVQRRLEAGAVAADGAAFAAARLIEARIEVAGGNIATADRLLAEAEARLPNSAAPRTRLRFVALHALVKKDLGQIEPAMGLFQEALALADDLGEVVWRVEVRCGLARVQALSGQLDRALEINAEALQLAADSGDPMTLFMAHLARGALLDSDGNRVAVREALEAALRDAGRAHSRSGEALALSNLSDVYLKSGDFRTALDVAEKAHALTQQLHDADGEVIALFNVGMARIGLGNLEQGKRDVAASIAIDERRGALNSMSESYRELGETLEQAGDAAGAVRALHRHRDLADDIVRRDQQRGVVELQARYDEERRTRDLALLGRENEIKGAQLRRQALQQQLWWLLAVSFSVSLAVLLWLHGRVRRANRLVELTNAELAAQGARDPLTGLANRRHFHADLLRTPAGQAFGAAVLLLDIDHFKSINDRHGHAGGDQVLVEVAERLRAALEPQHLIVRWGGEEFLVLLRPAVGAGTEAAEAVAVRLLQALSQTALVVQGRELALTASIGFASFPLGPDRLAVDAEQAIRLVDAALYLAKARGRNRAVGVTALQAPDAAAFEAAAADLDAAAGAGRAQLGVHIGRPVALKVAA